MTYLWLVFCDKWNSNANENPFYWHSITHLYTISSLTTQQTEPVWQYTVYNITPASQCHLSPLSACGRFLLAGPLQASLVNQQWACLFSNYRKYEKQMDWVQGSTQFHLSLLCRLFFHSFLGFWQSPFAANSEPLTILPFICSHTHTHTHTYTHTHIL